MISTPVSEPGGAALGERAVAMARDAGVRIALAESCTGGMISGEITSVEGASAVFAGGVVAYSDAFKQEFLGVTEAALRDHGAVSSEVARQMAEGVRARSGSELALAVTGVAGPGGGSDAKPVGTVWFAVSSAAGTRTVHHLFSGDRTSVRSQATITALNLIVESCAQMTDTAE